jgi:hypothetical protein
MRERHIRWVNRVPTALENWQNKQWTWFWILIGSGLLLLLVGFTMMSQPTRPTWQGGTAVFAGFVLSVSSLAFVKLALVGPPPPGLEDKKDGN